MNTSVVLLIIAFPLLLLATSFTRVFIILSFIKKGLGEVGLPSGQIVFGLSLLFSILIMRDPFQKIYDLSVLPYLDGKKTASQALKEAELPLRSFMAVQVSQSDLEFVSKYNQQTKVEGSFITLLGAFALSELKKGLFIGFLIWIPFLIIDLFTSVFTTTAGLHHLNPALVSLPLKVLLFLALDGWKLLFGTIAESYWVR
ncbi:MAG: flagellar type III secretion system pore protein FliP [Bdellovibrionota bacterium]